MKENVICKKCGSIIHYDPYFQKYICRQCGTTYAKDEVKEAKQMANIPKEKDVVQFLMQNKIPCQIKGFRYVADAIITFNPNETMEAVYCRLAEKHNDSITCVKRSIQYAISKSNKGKQPAQFIAEAYYALIYQSF